MTVFIICDFLQKMIMYPHSRSFRDINRKRILQKDKFRETKSILRNTAYSHRKMKTLCNFLVILGLVSSQSTFVKATNHRIFNVTHQQLDNPLKDHTRKCNEDTIHQAESNRTCQTTDKT
jgi:Mn-dependent DtxR family transcriptional regulator